MKKYLFAFAALWFGFPAIAADMPVKARPAPLPLFYGGSGAYWTIDVGAEQTKLGTVNGVNNVSAAGGTMGLGFGYVRAMGIDSWAAIEGTVNATNADATAETGVGPAVNVKRKYSFDVTAMYGAPVSRLNLLFSNSGVAFGALPTPCVGVADCVATNVHPFILVGAHYGQTTTQIVDAVPAIVAIEETHKRLRFNAGVGALVQINTSTVWRTTAAWTFGSGNTGAGFLLTPGANLKDGGTFTAKTGFAYALNFAN